jgi:hypothetical protein
MNTIYSIRIQSGLKTTSDALGNEQHGFKQLSHHIFYHRKIHFTHYKVRHVLKLGN